MSHLEIGLVDTLTTGTVGPQGQRVFYLQATAEGQTFTLRLEKTQVLAMAEHLANLLEDLPEIQVQDWTSAPDLIEPVEEIWRVGVMGAMYDSNSDEIVVMAEEVNEDPDSADAATATFRLARAITLAFIERAHEVVDAGRPPCQWCNRPLNYGEDGFCICWN